jgi:hypothetical protein
MNNLINSLAARIGSTLFCGTTLIACGGGGSGADNVASAASPVQSASLVVSNNTPVSSAAIVTATITPLPPTPVPDLAPGTITDVRFENTDSKAQTNVPVTFGQVFAVGNVLPTDALAGQFSDGSALPLQVDVKALHPDGSVRHAVISAVLPTLAAGETRTAALKKAGAVSPAPALSTGTLLGAGFSASVHATINGVKYNAFADDLLKAGSHTTWLAGKVANEWQVSAPLTTNSGVAHPHLSARFAIRWYQSIKKARVDVTVENDWAYEPAPQNFTYDAEVRVAAKPVYSKPALTHLHHARWRKVFWWGGNAPQINIKHNTKYLIASRAVPNYDQSLTVPETSLNALATSFSGPRTEPMAVGLAVPYMPTTGGRDDIGLMPSWAAMYLLSMDKRARDATLGTADLSGSWSSHYRDKSTGRPVRLKDYPYMTIYGRQGDTLNPATKKLEAFPSCASGACTSPNTHDIAHQAAFAYLPYLLTGDYYYLEELQFWSMWNVFSENPEYRQDAKGLLKSNQVRGQAWSLRTLSEAAYITPDSDPLKADFVAILSNNLDWYNSTYSNNANANKLGVVTNGYAFSYNNGTGIAPWQDDFFTSAVGHIAELGFDKASALLAWKSKFPIARMTDPGACWIDAGIYSLTIQDNAAGPVYSTFAQAYKASHSAAFNLLGCGSAEMAASLNLKAGEMTGYSSSATGYPANMQPALAYSADVGGQAGKNAWAVFTGRSVKPNYNGAPQFAIVPR